MPYVYFWQIYIIKIQTNQKNNFTHVTAHRVKVAWMAAEHSDKGDCVKVPAEHVVLLC
jgi:hypothetical protein